MVKTEISSSVVNNVQNETTRSGTQPSERAKEASVEDARQSSADSSEAATREESVHVAGARDVYMRTEQAANAAPGRPLKTSEQAAELAENLTDRLRKEPEKAIEAQAKGVSPNLANLLR